ncbi:MAG: 7-cyano-7-deazaguanine synthase QueC [Thiomargarita sp.]|nr:7-cyano-7-deazaguanine synthase QueC [Thiomargarita sp.]
MNAKKAIVLISGGLDSATTLALAQSQNYSCYALSFDYGQRHKIELQAARQIAQKFGVIEHKFIHFNLDSIGGSALTDTNIDVPVSGLSQNIPITYVPARNTVFLSLALAWAEVLSVYELFMGINAVDYSGYPDCRPEFITAFENMANVATKAGVEGHTFKVHTPLIHLSKAKIIQLGLRLGVDYSITISCYQANQNGEACGLCEACRLRADGFKSLDISDPTRYVTQC